MTKVTILGAEWTVEEHSGEDEELNECDGYCDHGMKMIVIQSDPEVSNKDHYKKQVLRHEVIHAFLFESGLGFNTANPKFGHDEQMIDWFAIQYPKIKKVYEELDCG